MKLSQVKSILENLTSLTFALENGELVPAHFHVTEVGQITRNFIDCGGKVRNETTVNFQLWSTETDIDHRLNPSKLSKIIELSEQKLNIQDCEVEVEFQSDTIGKYSLDFDGNNFILKATQTNCLAQDQCGIPVEKPRIKLASIGQTDEGSSCTPGGGCC